MYYTDEVGYEFLSSFLDEFDGVEDSDGSLVGQSIQDVHDGAEET